MKKVLLALAMTAFATASFAADLALVAKSIPLKDGATVYIFKDGKMAMEDKVGRIVRMKEGVVMETKSGDKIVMFGNEVARLDWYSSKDSSPGK